MALTTDTATNIKKAGKKLLRPEWHACSCHVLQLCANKILNEPSVKATFAKHNRLTGHLHSSASSMDKLKTLQQVRYGVGFSSADGGKANCMYAAKNLPGISLAFFWQAGERHTACTLHIFNQERCLFLLGLGTGAHSL